MGAAWPYKNIAIDPQLHMDISMAAAKAGLSKKKMAEKAILYGLHNGVLAKALREVLGADSLEDAQAIADEALAEYDGKE